MQQSSGRFVLRIPPGLHLALRHRAQREKCSLNALCETYLQQGLVHRPPSKWDFIVTGVLPPLKQQFGTNLRAVIAFGSRVRGEARANSDLDLLVVLDDTVPIRRLLYHWWDTITWPHDPPYEMNPHFVHRPSTLADSSGLWLEVALAHEVLYEHGRSVADTLAALGAMIAHGDCERTWSHGHPYWIRRHHAE